MPCAILSEFRDPTIPKLANLKRARAGRPGRAEPDALGAGRGPGAAGRRGARRRGGAGRPALHRPVGLADRGHGDLVQRRPAPERGGPRRRGRSPRPWRGSSRPCPGIDGGPRGVVFVQPLVAAEVAGITFFDGFYFEEARAEGTNAALTSGRSRGDVRRGHLRRGDPHARLAAAASTASSAAGSTSSGPGLPRGGRVLLQVRPALFPIRRNETLSLANHKEILGDPPSPWMVGVMAEVGRPVLAIPRGRRAGRGRLGRAVRGGAGRAGLDELLAPVPPHGPLGPAPHPGDRRGGRGSGRAGTTPDSSSAASSGSSRGWS